MHGAGRALHAVAVLEELPRGSVPLGQRVAAEIGLPPALLEVRAAGGIPAREADPGVEHGRPGEPLLAAAVAGGRPAPEDHSGGEEDLREARAAPGNSRGGVHGGAVPH